MPDVRPKMKAVFPRYKANSLLVIHGKNGQCHDIEDPFGHAEYLFSLLDGSRTTDEIVQQFLYKFPDVTPDEVLQTITEFDEMKLLEDASAVPLDEYKMERYSRNLGFFEIYASLDVSKYEFQERLCNAHVALLGVGGVGSHVALSLAGLGVGRVTIVDYDNVELSNLNRQILYKEQEIGQSKLEIAAQRIQEYGNKTVVTAIKKRLMSADDVKLAVQGCDLAIVAVDRPKTTILDWINEGCIAAGVPFITGGVDRDRAFHYTVVPGVTGCITCWRRESEEADPFFKEILDQMTEHEAAGGRFGEDTAAYYPLVAVQAAGLTAELTRMITGITPPLALGRVLSVPFDSFETVVVESWSRNESCAVCGHLPQTVFQIKQTVSNG